MSTCNILWPCEEPDCKFTGLRPKWKLHMREHSLGKKYCLPCNKFMERMDKHVKTKSHIENASVFDEHAGMVFNHCWVVFLLNAYSATPTSIATVSSYITTTSTNYYFTNPHYSNSTSKRTLSPST